MKDPRRPLVVLDVEETADGMVRVVFDRESTERIRSGYACAKCLQTFDEPWPERCFICGAPVRDRQAEFFMREYGGVEQLGSRVSLQDELAALPERVRKENGNGS